MFRRLHGGMQATIEGEYAMTLIRSGDAAQALKEGIATYKFLSDQAMAGCNILIQDPITGTEELLIMPVQEQADSAYPFRPQLVLIKGEKE